MKSKKSLKSAVQIAIAAFLAISPGKMLAQLAQPFTPGDLVVERLGDNSKTNTIAGTPIFFDEITPGGALVQSIEIPTNGVSSLVDNGVASSQGGMTLSANGKYVVFPGYNTTAGFPSLTTSTAAAVPRGIGQLDANGNYTLPITNASAFSASTYRGAASDGNGNYWGSGTSSGSPQSGGIWYFGTSTAAVHIYNTAANANIRDCDFFNGHLYYSTASSTAPGYGIWQITNNFVAGTPTNFIPLVIAYGTWNFSVSPDGNTVYSADDASENATNGGIHKFTFSGGVWNYNYLLVSNTPCFGLVVNWNTVPPTLYATTAGSTNGTSGTPVGNNSPSNAVIELQDTGINSVVTTNATAAQFEVYRGLSFVPTNASLVAQAPTITGITPLSLTIATGGNATFTLSGNTGDPIGSNRWYQVVGNTTNQVAGQTGASLAFVNAVTGETGNYFAIITNASGSVTSAVVSLTVTAIPAISAINPSGSITQDYGSSITFSLTSNPGNPPASNFWFQVAGTTTNVTYTTNATLTINNLAGPNTARYFAVLTNIFGSVTSAVVSLTITNDPSIQAPPVSSFGLLDGQVQFSVAAVGSAPINYQWYFADPNGNHMLPVGAGNAFGDTAVVYGPQTSLLTVSNLQNADLTNFVVVVSNVYGSVTSSVASILGINTTLSPLAFWSFGGNGFTNTVANPSCVSNPVPTYGVGAASAVGTDNNPAGSPFVATTSADPSGGPGAYEFGIPLPQPGFSWGVGLILGTLPQTNNIPTDINNSNKMSGVQFNVSTVGAKNIKFQFDSRATQTASEYGRVQYTTNGTLWIDYPAAYSYNGDSGSGAGGWQTYPVFDVDDGQLYDNYPDTAPITSYYDFSGFPGVANNPLFGVRIVEEYQSTATYGILTTNNYVGIGEAYALGGDGGTITFDLVGLYGDAITNNNVPPVISPLTNTITGQVITNTAFEATLDNVPVTNSFYVSGDATADHFTYSAQSLNASQFNPGVQFFPSSSGIVKMVLTPNPITPNTAAAPILVTVTDIKGDSVAAWFILSVSTQFPAPVISGLNATNTVANSTNHIPFSVSSALDPVSQFTYSATSGNNAVVPSANIAVTTSSPGTPANPVITVIPAHNQLGVGVITVTVDDHNSSEDKTATATIPLTVEPNTNVVAIDYFNYDNSGPIDQVTVSGGFWQHLSGLLHGMVVTSQTPNPGSVYVDTAHQTENMQTPLVGAPYSTNANAVVKNLYYSFIVNMDPANLPNSNGTYFAALNDGQLITSDVDDLLVAATNGVSTPGDYRLGIASDNGADANGNSTTIVPVDLVPGSNYVIVTSLTLSNGLARLWINPSSQSSIHADSNPDNNTVAYPISDFELRESGLHGGGITVSYLKVGTTFDSVFPSLQVTPVGTKVIINWSDPTLGLQMTTNLQTTPFADLPSATPPYTNNASTNSVMFFKFGR